MGAFRQNAIWNFMNEADGSLWRIAYLSSAVGDRKSRARTDKHEPDWVRWDVKRARFLTTDDQVPGYVCIRGKKRMKNEAIRR